MEKYDYLKLLLLLIGFVAWLVRLESRAKHLEKNQDIIWKKVNGNIDDIQENSKSISKIEGKLERH